MYSEILTHTHSGLESYKYSNKCARKTISVHIFGGESKDQRI
jgi:hypothetical protein